MRGRLIRGMLAITLVAVIAMGVPLLLLARHQVWTAARDALRQQAASVAAGLEDRLDARQPVDLSRYTKVLRARRILVTDPDGSRTAAGPEFTGPVLQASVTISGSTVTVQAAQSASVIRAREVTVLVLALALLAAAAAVALAVWQARRLTDPLAELVHRADALGRADFAPTPTLSGIPEIDAAAAPPAETAVRIATRAPG